MSTTRLPPLPPGYPIQWTPNPDGPTDIVYVFDEVHAYGLAVWKAAMQQAVATCKAVEVLQDNDNGAANTGGAAQCAEALSALPLPEQGGPQERREG